MYAPSFIRFNNTRHAVGDEECEDGYCSGYASDGETKYPIPCHRPGCRGLIHAAVVPGDDAALTLRCDCCGCNYLADDSAPQVGVSAPAPLELDNSENIV